MSLIENKAELDGCKDVWFRDTSWRKNTTWKIYRGHMLSLDKMDKREMCVKVPIKCPWDEKDCIQHIKKFKEIQGLAKEFTDNLGLDSEIRVLIPEKGTLHRRASVHTMKGRRRTLSRDEWLLAYPLLRKGFSTFVNKKGRARECDVLEAFVHFTFHKNGGNSVVSKLRGVKDKSKFTLSCPSLHTSDNEIQKVMKNHKCNDLCRWMQVDFTPIPPVIPLVQPSAPPPPEYDDVDCKNHEVIMDMNEQMLNLYQNQHVVEKFLHYGNSWYTYRQFQLYVNGRNVDFCRRRESEDWEDENQIQSGCNPPPYSMECPSGHHRAGQIVDKGQSDLLTFADSAPVQQRSLYGQSCTY